MPAKIRLNKATASACYGSWLCFVQAATACQLTCKLLFRSQLLSIALENARGGVLLAEGSPHLLSAVAWPITVAQETSIWTGNCSRQLQSTKTTYLANQPMMGAAAQPARQQGRHILLYPVAACQKLDEEPSRADCTCQSQACELSVTLRNLFCRSLRPLRMTESLHLMILNPAPQGCERNRLMSQQLGQISCFQLLLRSAAGSAACSHPDNRISESSSICGHHLDQRAPHRTRAPSKVKICLAAVKVEARRG